MNKFFNTCALAIACATTLATSASYAQQDKKFPVISLTAGMNIIKAEVASNEAERQQGLMNRASMGPVSYTHLTLPTTPYV